MKMSNSWGKIIFHLNLVFLLAASATDESVNKKNDLNTIKERINSRYYEFFNELYSNRYLIGNCSYEDEDLHGEDLYNTQIESIESYCNKTITANNNNKLLMCEERIDNYLIYLKADLYNMNSCRNKNKTFQEDDYKRMNMSKEFLLKMHDKNITLLNPKNFHLLEFYNTILDYLDKNIEILSHCSTTKITKFNLLVKNIKQLLANHATNDKGTNIYYYQEIQKEYLSFKNYSKYIDECTNLKKNATNNQNAIYNNWRIKKESKQFF
ncbi:uncharacterized protein LOC122503991 isoform X1 [Leptopilina heterotoma]|uniref:uncharacterized protein LOC122503991 isoform X1 n=1 Tax=Leptopilina heterotoma TaxID=63436 RepID=UPI001CA9C68E|nr:uncharacterized protein LOC122503991 isoform X1 [Leptopilina heterotoma]